MATHLEAAEAALNMADQRLDPVEVIAATLRATAHIQLASLELAMRWRREDVGRVIQVETHDG